MWRRDRSWVENFLTSWAPLLLGAMAVTSLLLRYVRDPISCHYVYPQANEYFTEDCFQQTSVLMRSDEFTKYTAQQWGGKFKKDAPNPFQVWPKQRTFHHWVPFALGVAAILCLLPHVVWRLISALLWLDKHGLVQTLAAGDNQSQSSTGRHVTLKDSAVVVEAGLREEGNWKLTAGAMGVKVMAAMMCALQMVLIVLWFKPPLGGGAGVDEEAPDLTSVNVTVPDSLEDVPLPVDPFFCTVEFTHHRNSQTMTMQCVLPLNKVFVKAFIFLFYFFLLFLILSLLDLFYWLGRLFLPGLSDVTLLRNLSIISQSEGAGHNYYSAHFGHFLGCDGRLVLAVMADHCGPVTTLHFTRHLWHAFMGTSSAPSHGSASMSPGTSSAPSRGSASLSAGKVAGDVKMEEGKDQGAGISSTADIPLREIPDQQTTVTEDDRARLYDA